MMEQLRELIPTFRLPDHERGDRGGLQAVPEDVAVWGHRALALLAHRQSNVHHQSMRLPVFDAQTLTEHMRLPLPGPEPQAGPLPETILPREP